MTLFYKFAFYTLAIGLLTTALLTHFYEFNSPLVYSALFTLFTLFLGLSGVVEKKTIKVLGTEVLGLSAVLLGSVYILFSLLFLYVIVLAFFDSMLFDGVYETLTTLWFILTVFYFLLPENENIKFGIMKPWHAAKYQEKVETIEHLIQDKGYEYFLTHVDIDSFMQVLHLFDVQIQQNIFKNMNERTREHFVKKQEELKAKKLLDEEIEEILNNIIANIRQEYLKG